MEKLTSKVPELCSVNLAKSFNCFLYYCYFKRKGEMHFNLSFKLSITSFDPDHLLYLRGYSHQFENANYLNLGHVTIFTFVGNKWS